MCACFPHHLHLKYSPPRRLLQRQAGWKPFYACELYMRSIVR